MKVRSRIDMLKATRLTCEGRLSEAMAILRGEGDTTEPDLRTDTPTKSPTPPSPTPASSVIDMVPPSSSTGGAWTPAEEPGRADAHDAGGLAAGSVSDALRRFVGIKPKFTAGNPAGICEPRTDHHHAPERGGPRFEEFSFASADGSRAYKLYVPGGYDGTPLPLVVMLHGCTQSPEDFAAGTRMNDLAEEQIFLVAYPAQPQSANSSKCWNWFNTGDQHRDRGEPALIAGITRQVMRDFNVASDRVYVAGLSAGGAAAAIMGVNYPDLYAAIGVHSGLACGAASDVSSAFTAMRQGAGTIGTGSQGHSQRRGTVPTIVFHGDRDMTVSAINSDQVIAQSKGDLELFPTTIHGEAAGGIKFTRTVESDSAGHAVLEQWTLHGAGHAWSGGSKDGSFTDPRGPDASREMVRFFRDHKHRAAGAAS
jgi:poly(hydroxyalkanoate) depolymerase family esterase